MDQGQIGEGFQSSSEHAEWPTRPQQRPRQPQRRPSDGRGGLFHTLRHAASLQKGTRSATATGSSGRAYVGSFRDTVARDGQNDVDRPRRGWENYFRFCTGASDQFAVIDHYVWDRIWRWLMKKHGAIRRKKTTLRRLPSRLRPTRRVWREGRTEQFLLSFLKVERFRRGWMHAPAYALVPGEPDA